MSTVNQLLACLIILICFSPPPPLAMMSNNNADTTCLVLFFLLVILILLLVYLYRRLNRDTNDQYTIRKLVLDEGGLRDRVRSGVVAVETRLGVHLWPRPRPSSDDEEEVIGDGQPLKDRDVETGQSPSDNCNQGDGDQGKGEHDEGDDSEDDYSSMDGTDLRERANLMKDVEDEDNNQEGERRKEGGRKEEESDKGKEDEKEDGKSTENLGLLVNLQELSGSAIWSGENKDENESIDLTAL